MADGMEDGGVRGEVEGWRIVGDASDGAWEEGMATLAVPSSCEDGCGMFGEERTHAEAWW
jgi:hypothetical protein